MERCLACEADAVGTMERCLPAAAGRGRGVAARHSFARTDGGLLSGSITDLLHSVIVTTGAGRKLTHQTFRTMLEKRDETKLGTLTLRDLPARKGARPTTLRGPLHIQCNGHGDRKYVDQLVKDVLSWPHIEPLPALEDRTATIPIRFEKGTVTDDSAPFISAREFARVLLGAPTIYIALPLVCAHWAIVQGWAEPHYLGSFGLLPAGTVVVYSPKDRDELSVCYALFSAAYQSAFKGNNQEIAVPSLEMSSRAIATAPQ